MLFQPLPATCQTRVELKGQTKASEEMVWSAHPIVQSPKGVSVVLQPLSISESCLCHGLKGLLLL